MFHLDFDEGSLQCTDYCLALMEELGARLLGLEGKELKDFAEAARKSGREITDKKYKDDEEKPQFGKLKNGLPRFHGNLGYRMGICIDGFCG